MCASTHRVRIRCPPDRVVRSARSVVAPVPPASGAQMLLDQRTAVGIRDGVVTLAFRRWVAPRVTPGGSFLSSVGVVLVGSVDEVSGATLDEALAAGASSVDEVVGGRTELPLYRIELSW